MSNKMINIVIPFYKQSDFFLNNIKTFSKDKLDWLKIIVVFNEEEKKRFEGWENENDNLELISCKNSFKKNMKLSMSASHLNDGWVVVLDPDDEINLMELKKILEIKIPKDVKFLINSFYWKNESENFVQTFFLNKQKNIRMSKLSKMSFLHPLHNSAMIISTELFEKNILPAAVIYDEIEGQDVFLGLAFTNNLTEEEIFLIDQPFITYNWFNISNTNTYSEVNQMTTKAVNNNLNLLNSMLNYQKSPFVNFAEKAISSDIISNLNNLRMPSIAKELISKNSTLKNNVTVTKKYFLIESNFFNFSKKIDINKGSEEWLANELAICFTLYDESDDQIINMSTNIQKFMKDNFLNNEVIFIIDRETNDERLISFRKEFPRINFYSNELNGGKTKSIKTASKLITSKWVKFFDPDDPFVKNAKEWNDINYKILNLKTSANIILHSILLTNIKNKTDKKIALLDEGVWDRGVIKINETKILPFNANKIYRSSAIRKNLKRIKDINMHEDVHMTANLAFGNFEVVYFDCEIYNYIFGQGITSNSKLSNKDRNDMIVTLNSYKNKIDKYPIIFQNELLIHNYQHALILKGKKPKDILLKIEKIISKKVEDPEIIKYLTKGVEF